MKEAPGGRKTIFWDFDGTLGYRPEGWAGSLLALLKGQAPDCAVTIADLRPLLQEGFTWHTPEIAHPELGDPDAYWRRLEPVFVDAYARNGVDRQTAERLAPRMRDRLADPATYRLYDDTLPVLRALSERSWRHQIITNHVPEFPTVLEALGLMALIEQVTNSGNVGYEKPHPEIYIYRLALAAAGHPADRWMIGDNVAADVLGAERVGIPGILVRHQDGRARRCAANLQEAMAIILAE
ncbi:MAG: HAD family hydrolase [Chloroflexota bacterium]